MRPSRAILSEDNFWNLQEIYELQTGILYTQVGYTGGWLPNPNYQDVISGKSGHVEAVEITYNPSETDYEKIIDIFFKSHKSKLENKKNKPLHSIIFYLSKEQQNIAEKKRQNHQKNFKQKITTEIRPASFFYPAEIHHQHYLIKPGQTSCCLTKEC